MKKLLVASTLLLAVIFLADKQDAHAQMRVDLAPNFGYGANVFNQVGDPGTISVGAQGHLYLIEREDKKFSLIINPALDYYLFDIEGMSGLQLDVNGLVSFGRRTSTITPYGGLGLALSVVTGDEEPPLLSDVESGTGIGVNVLGGLLFGGGSPRIMTQLRYTIGSHELHRDSGDASASSGLQFHGGLVFRLN